jgi:hypothetical protein
MVKKRRMARIAKNTISTAVNSSINKLNKMLVMADNE